MLRLRSLAGAIALLLVTLPRTPGQDGAAAPGEGPPVLRRGDRGPAVRVLQVLLAEVRRLADGGGDELTADGDYGPATERAVSAFQRAHRLSAGPFEASSWRALHDAVRSGPLGAIDPLARDVAPDLYQRDRGDPRDVALHLLAELEVREGVRARPIVYESKMTIDADGSGDAWKGDPDGQPGTALEDDAGAALDPTRVPYFVLPVGFTARHAPARLGDVAAVFHAGHVAYAIFGDTGPRDLIGEGSIALARALGIDPDPVHGGTDAGVVWIVFPGSGTGHALPPAEVARRGEALLRRAGGRPDAAAR